MKLGKTLQEQSALLKQRGPSDTCLSVGLLQSLEAMVVLQDLKVDSRMRILLMQKKLPAIQTRRTFCTYLCFVTCGSAAVDHHGRQERDALAVKEMAASGDVALLRPQPPPLAVLV